MKKIFILLLIAAGTWGLSIAAGEAAPRAAVEEERHNFGTAYAGSKVFHTFVIENVGDEDLVIKSVRTG
ncbi:MAG: DUF1573 domain-containing protein [Desulfosalsimonas sp.]